MSQSLVMGGGGGMLWEFTLEEGRGKGKGSKGAIMAFVQYCLGPNKPKCDNAKGYRAPAL